MLSPSPCVYLFRSLVVFLIMFITHHAQCLDWGALMSSVMRLHPNRALSHVFDFIEKQISSNKPRTMQSEQCHLVQRLPHDLILEITDHLPLSHQVFLSQTCTALRYALGHLPKPQKLPRLDKLDYLTVLAKDQPDYWVCDVCCSLHPVHRHDTPAGSSDQFPCQRQTTSSLLCEYNLAQRHVQQALKYKRLEAVQSEQRELLRDIMKPQHLIVPAPTGRDTPAVNLNCWVWPKIVDGRFLLMTKWSNPRYFITNHQHNEFSFWFLIRHQGSIFPWYRHTYTYNGRSMPQRCGRSPCLNCDDCQVQMAGMAACNRPGKFVNGYDLDSPSDFAFRLNEEGEGEEVAELFTWQDLGHECSPSEYSWGQTELRDGDRSVQSRGRGCKPHSVRILFERDGKEWPEFETRTQKRTINNLYAQHLEFLCRCLTWRKFLLITGLLLTIPTAMLL